MKFKVISQALVVLAVGLAFALALIGCPTDSPEPTVTGVSISPATATVARGESRDFSATVLGTNDPPTTVSWWVDGVSGTTITPAGRLTVATNEPATTLTVQAISTHDTSRIGTASVSVTAPAATVTGVTVSPSIVTLARGGNQDFTATVLGTNNPPQTVTWTVTTFPGVGIAPGTTISSDGRLTVAANETATTLTVRATSTHDTSVSGTASIIVPPGNITWTAVAYGSPTTTAVNFTFSASPSGLTAGDITITAGTGSATGGALTGTGTTRTLAVSGVSPGTVTVSINSPSIAPGPPQTVTLVAPDITWTAAAYGSPTTTAVNFTFSASPTGLTAGDITITAGTGSATGGALTGTGTTRTLAVSNVNAGTVYIYINRLGIAAEPQTVTLVVAPITWNAVALGTPTTSIEFAFNEDPGLLQVADFISAPGGGSATFGALTGTGTARTLAVSDVTAGNMSVSIVRAGIETGVRTVALIAGTGPSPSGFVRVPGGTFLMGSPEGTPNSNANERPVRAVTVSGFSMGRHVVTQGEWYDVMGTRPSFFNGTNNETGTTVTPTFQWRNLPVERVSWYDAIVFSNRLSIARGLTPAYSIGGSTNPDDWGPVPTSWNATWNAVTIVPGSTGYRLPTEAQWEFAARGGHGSPGNFTFSGSNVAAEVAWHSANSGRRTREVGTLAPNALGLYDMSGNVWEWVWDWWGTYPDYPETDPTGASSGSDRVVRGGGWGVSDWGVRSASRLDVAPADRFDGLGFRLVRP